MYGHVPDSSLVGGGLPYVPEPESGWWMKQSTNPSQLHPLSVICERVTSESAVGRAISAGDSM